MDILILQLDRCFLSTARFQVKSKTLIFLGGQRYPLGGEACRAMPAEAFEADNAGETVVILSMEAASLYYREMKLPFNDRRKIREILPLELKGETLLDTEDAVFDAVPMIDGRHLVVWGQRTQVAGYLASLAEHATDPQAVSCAALHWRALLPDNADGWIALSDGTAIALFDNRDLAFFRALNRESFAEDIEKTLAALELTRGIRVARLYLFGAAAAEQSALQAPDQIAVLPVTGRLAEAFAGNREHTATFAGEWTLADAWLSGSPVNFRYGELASTSGIEKKRKQLRIAALLAGLIMLLLFAEAGIRYAAVRKDLDSLDASITALYSQVFPDRKKAVDEVAELTAEIGRMGGSVESRSVLPELKKIANIKGDDIGGFYEIECVGNQVRLKGEAESIRSVNDFRSRAAKLFTSAEVGEIKSRPGGGVSFVFRGVTEEGGK